MFSPANDIMIIHRGKKGIRGSVQASSVTRKREMSLLVSNSFSFFLSFEDKDILDLENLRSVIPWPILGGKGGMIIKGGNRKEFDTGKHGRVCKFERGRKLIFLNTCFKGMI